MEERAIRESHQNPRYRWLGGLPHWQARRLLAGSHLFAITSTIEGSSNALSESLVLSTPVIASRIPGLVGTLGEDYPGYFAPGDTGALASLFQRAELDSTFYDELVSRCALAAALVAPERELAAWSSLLDEIGASPARSSMKTP
jgi:glycosyltransferase involved in cell wall biosynthesis